MMSERDSSLIRRRRRRRRRRHHCHHRRRRTDGKETHISHFYSHCNENDTHFSNSTQPIFE